MRGSLAALGVSAIVACVGGAAIYAATGDGPRLMGMQHGPGPTTSAHASGPPRDAATEPTTLHGEFVVVNASGGFTTEIAQTGKVTAISATSLTARSEDGFSQTYVIAALSPVAAAVPPFAVNDAVTIRATRTGAIASVTSIDWARPGHA